MLRLLLALLAIAPAIAAPSVPLEVQRGLALVESRGCVACHSLDGTRRIGPSFLGRFGAEVPLTADDGPRTVRVDAEYVARAVAEPEAEIADGYPPGTMPPTQLAPAELDALVAALRHLNEPDVVAAERREEGTILWLVLGALLFVLGHLGLSQIRDPLIGRLGAGGYEGLYSLVALIGLGVLIYGWGVAPYAPLWAGPVWSRWIPLLVMPLVMVLQVASFTERNPTTPKGDDLLRRQDHGVGYLAITRHPGLASTALWGLAHLPTNGDLTALLGFGSFTVLSVAGIYHIEARRRRQVGEAAWARIAATTSILPFWAILRGRTRLKFHQLGLIPLLGGLGLYVGVLLTHAWLFGASPLPG